MSVLSRSITKSGQGCPRRRGGRKCWNAYKGPRVRKRGEELRVMSERSSVILVECGEKEKIDDLPHSGWECTKGEKKRVGGGKTNSKSRSVASRKMERKRKKRRGEEERSSTFQTRIGREEEGRGGKKKAAVIPLAIFSKKKKFPAAALGRVSPGKKKSVMVIGSDRREKKSALPAKRPKRSREGKGGGGSRVDVNLRRREERADRAIRPIRA